MISQNIVVLFFSFKKAQSYFSRISRIYKAELLSSIKKSCILDRNFIADDFRMTIYF